MDEKGRRSDRDVILAKDAENNNDEFKNKLIIERTLTIRMRQIKFLVNIISKETRGVNTVKGL